MLTGSYQSIQKALAHGVPSQIAAAVMSCDAVRKHIVKKVLKIVTKEVTELCSKRRIQRSLTYSLSAMSGEKEPPSFIPSFSLPQSTREQKIHGGFEALLSRALFS